MMFSRVCRRRQVLESLQLICGVTVTLEKFCHQLTWLRRAIRLGERRNAAFNGLV